MGLTDVERPFQGRGFVPAPVPRPSAWADRIGLSGRKSPPFFEPERLVLSAQGAALGRHRRARPTLKGSFIVALAQPVDQHFAEAVDELKKIAGEVKKKAGRKKKGGGG